MLWGETDRVIVMLEVRHQGIKCNRTRNVIFMIDTASQYTIISPEVRKLIMKDCKIKANTPSKVPIEINGRPILAKVSKDTFYFDTNVLGMDFIKEY